MRRFIVVRGLLELVRQHSLTLCLMGAMFGAFFFPADSSAQAVPPRVQVPIMTERAKVPPPVAPVQRRINEVEKQVQANKRELERRKLLDSTVVSLAAMCTELRRQLAEEQAKPGGGNQNFVKHLQKQISDCEKNLKKGK